MAKDKRKKWVWMLIIIFVLLIVAGIATGELKMLHRLGSFICFECIGLG